MNQKIFSHLFSVKCKYRFCRWALQAWNAVWYTPGCARLYLDVWHRGPETAKTLTKALNALDASYKSCRLWCGFFGNPAPPGSLWLLDKWRLIISAGAPPVYKASGLNGARYLIWSLSSSSTNNAGNSLLNSINIAWKGLFHSFICLSLLISSGMSVLISFWSLLDVVPKHKI